MTITPSPRPHENDKRRSAAGAPPVLGSNDFILICERLAETGSKYKSCEELGFAYGTVRDAIKSMFDRGDSSWQDLWDESYQKFRHTLEDEMIRRARDGVEEPVFGKDGVIGHKRVFSDRLMEVAVKGHFPERYRDNIAVSGTIGLEPVDAFANLTPKAKREIRAIIMRDLEEQRAAATALQLEDQSKIQDAEFIEIDSLREADEGDAQ